MWDWYPRARVVQRHASHIGDALHVRVVWPQCHSWRVLPVPLARQSLRSAGSAEHGSQSAGPGGGQGRGGRGRRQNNALWSGHSTGRSTDGCGDWAHDVLCSPPSLQNGPHYT